MRALSVRQPWAWAIVFAGKDVENRSRRDPWRAGVGERIYLHSSSTADPHDDELARTLARHPDPELPAAARICGALLGTVRLAGVHHATECALSCSRWAQPGSWHLELSQPRALAEPIPWRGALGLFQVPQPHDGPRAAHRGTVTA